MPEQTVYAQQHPAVSNRMPAPIVVGGGINGLSAVRSLAQSGLSPLVVVTSLFDVAAVSRYARPVAVGTFDGETLLNEMIQLRSRLPQGGALIFVEDSPLLALSPLRDRLAPYFGFQIPSHQLLLDLAVKERFFQLAQQYGFPVPRTLLLRKYSDLGGLHDLRLPLCVKPNSHTKAYHDFFKKAYRVDKRSVARQLCERILDTVGEVIVQEWIEGPNDSIYFSLCYMGEPGPVAFTGRKGRSWPPQIGITASCWPAQDVAQELEHLTIHFFQSVGLTKGYASMEYKRDQRDGRFLMVEPTAGRTDGQVEISALCGINLCQIAYCDAARLPRPPLKLDPRHVWRDEFRDFLAAWKLRTRRSYPPGYKIHNAFWRWNDPAPALLQSALNAKMALNSVFDMVLAEHRGNQPLERGTLNQSNTRRP